MERRTVARALRAMRRRKRWTQTQLGARLRTSKSEISRWERGALDTCTVEEVERWATALGAHVFLELRTDGERPLVDAKHARIQAWLVTLLREAGWMAEPEVSFNHFGDRGRIDILACHATLATMLVIEIKTRLDDVQDTVGRLDVKRRVAPQAAASQGWTARTVVPALVVLEGSTARRRIADHAGVFGRYALRGAEAIAWLRQPRGAAPRGFLVFVNPGR